MIQTASRTSEFANFSFGSYQKGGHTYYRIRLPLKYNRTTINLGRDLTKAVNAASAIDKAITQQIAGGCIDIAVLKLVAAEYFSADQEKVVQLVTKKHSLIDLWNHYIEFHQNIKAWDESYFITTIRTVGSLIASSPYQHLEDKQKFVNWLFSDARRSPETSKARLKLIVAAIDWCSKQGIIARAYGIEWRDFLAFIKLKKQTYSINIENETEGQKVDIFKVKEIYTILDALKNNTYSRFKGRHSQYYSYVYFVWLTGCRPSEAIALKWSNIDLKKRRIKFGERQVNANGTICKMKGTKTQEYRFFPINPELEALLLKVPIVSDYVFTNYQGNSISQQAFVRVWKTLLNAANIRYRIPYQLRHSMISYHANNDYPLHKLAVLVGNSEEVIRNHYLHLDIERVGLPDVLKSDISISNGL